MCRDIVECTYSITPEEVGPDFAGAPPAWLSERAGKYGLTLLLAHADDGVIWGEIRDGKLVLSSRFFPLVSPKLSPETLQQARLFGPSAELLLWKNGDGAWLARVLADSGTDRRGWRFDEAQIQWGDRLGDAENSEIGGFTLVAEGQEGLRHAVPLAAATIAFDPPQIKHGRHHPLRLTVRHYAERIESDGTLVIVHGRLAGLGVEERRGGSDV